MQHREPAVGGRVAAHGQQVAEQNHLRTAKYSRTKSERCCHSSGTVDAESATAVRACPSTRFGLVCARAGDGTAACFAATVRCARKCGGSVHSSLHLHD